MIPAYVQLPDQDVEPYILMKHDLRYIHKNDTMSIFSKNGEEIPFKSREFKVTTFGDLVFVRKVYYVSSDDLPPMVKGRIYIVSKMMANILAGIRTDFSYPGTHPMYDKAQFVDSHIEAIKRFRLPDQVVLDDEQK
jgi:hypothetical protein